MTEQLPTEPFPVLAERGLEREGTTNLWGWAALAVKPFTDTAVSMLISVVGTELLLS